PSLPGCGRSLAARAPVATLRRILCPGLISVFSRQGLPFCSFRSNVIGGRVATVHASSRLPVMARRLALMPPDCGHCSCGLTRLAALLDPLRRTHYAKTLMKGRKGSNMTMLGKAYLGLAVVACFWMNGCRSAKPAVKYRIAVVPKGTSH